MAAGEVVMGIRRSCGEVCFEAQAQTHATDKKSFYVPYTSVRHGYVFLFTARQECKKPMTELDEEGEGKFKRRGEGEGLWGRWFVKIERNVPNSILVLSPHSHCTGQNP